MPKAIDRSMTDLDYFLTSSERGEILAIWQALVTCGEYSYTVYLETKIQYHYIRQGQNQATSINVLAAAFTGEIDGQRHILLGALCLVKLTPKTDRGHLVREQIA